MEKSISIGMQSATSTIGTLSNEDGNVNDIGSEKHISGSLFTYLCGSFGVCLFYLHFVNRKTIKYFSMKLNKYYKKVYAVTSS